MPLDEFPSIRVVSREKRRRRLQFGLLGLLILIGVAAGGFAWWRSRTPPILERWGFIQVRKVERPEGRIVTYTVVHRDGYTESYVSRDTGDSENLSALTIQDGFDTRIYGHDSIGENKPLDDGIRKSFEHVRTIVRSRVDFDRMPWLVGEPKPGFPHQAQFEVEKDPPRAETYPKTPANASTTTGTATPTVSRS
jgi:hypothetical protein